MLQPKIFKEGTYTEADIAAFVSQTPNIKVKNLYERQMAEVFEIDNPTLLFSPDFKEKQAAFVADKRKAAATKGDYVYYPWTNTLLHVVPEVDYFRIRTNRNKNIITAEEQQKLYDFTVGIAGMSVGSNIANNLTYAGISRSIKLADFDTLETSNLNRVRARLSQVGDPKIEIVAQQIYDVNPYADLHCFEEGLNIETLKEFMEADPKPRVIFEIIDDFKMKIQMRLMARERGIPVIMLTNLGDSVMIDIERYDLEPNLPIFNGKIGNVGEEILANTISKEDEKKYAIAIVGPENIPPKVLDSVKKIGMELVGRPQLMTTASVSSGLAAYMTRQIALGEAVHSGRRIFKFGDII